MQSVILQARILMKEFNEQSEYFFSILVLARLMMH